MSEPILFAGGHEGVRLPAACAALNAFLAEHPWRDPDAAAVLGAKVRGMVAGYNARWGESEWSLEGDPERTVQLPIVNPKTGRTSRTFTQAGKFDGIVSGYGKRLLLEHKSTGDDIADPNATYWRRLAIDSQVSKYLLQAWQSGEKLDGALYDVLRKPMIRPKRLAKADVTEITTRGTYCGQAVADADYQAVVRGLDQETPSLFEIRVAAETIAEPDRYFQRRTIPRLDSDVLEHADELWAISDEIRLARLSGRNFRNSAACLDYGRACEYLGICSGYDSETSDNWQRAASVHDELDGIDDGRNVLTNSRIKTFQTCRRKHYLRYEVGLRRVQEDEAEALYLGTALHVALAAWWATTTGELNGSSQHDGSAAIDVAEPAIAPE